MSWVSKKRSLAVPTQSQSALFNERPEKNVFGLPKHSASLVDKEFGAQRTVPQISIEDRYIAINKHKWLHGDAVPRDLDKFKAVLDNTVSSSGKTLERTLALERNQDKKPWKHNK